MHRHIAVILAYFVLSLVFTYPLPLHFDSAIPGDGFDSWQNYWNLWWVRRALLELNASPFFTAELYYPTGASLYFHTLNIFNGLWSLPVQAFSNLAVTYNTVLVFTFVVSGYGVYLLARCVLGDHLQGRGGQWVFALPPFIAGFIFAFSPFRMSHLLGHMQVLSTEWIPFFVLTFLQMHRRGSRWWRALLPALFLALNALCDWYYVLYLLLFAVVAVVWQWLAPQATGQGVRGASLLRLRSSALNLFAVVVLFSVFISPLLVPMLREAGSAAYLRPPFEETILLSADLLAFITPSVFHPWWGEAASAIAEHFTSTRSEYTVFAGFVTIVLAAAGAWRYRRAARQWLLTLLVFLVLALGPYLHVLGSIVAPVPLPYAWLYELVPLVRLTRSVSRFDVMVMLALAVLAALGLQALRARPRWAAACALLIAFEYLAIPYPLTPVEVPAFYGQMRSEPGTFAILELPIEWDRPHPLLYQTVHARPLVTAYTSRSNPLSSVERTPVLHELRTLKLDVVQYDTRAVAPSVLADFGVRYVIIHPLTMGEGEERTVTNRVLRQMFGNQQPVVKEENLVAYRVPAAEPYRPYVVLGDGWSDVQIVAGQPQRVIEREARFFVRARDDRTRIVRLSAQAQGAGLKLTAHQPEAGQPVQVTADFGTGTASSVDMLVRGNTALLITVSAPLVVESLELREP